MPKPAGDRRRGGPGEPRRRVEEGGAARPAVEVLVGAADREVDVAPEEVDGDRAGRVGEVPHAQRADIVRSAGERGHVVHAARSVVHVGQQQSGDVVTERGLDLIRLDPAHLVTPTEGLGEALRDVDVRREVAVIRQDDLPVAGFERGGERLMDLDREGVADDDLAWRRIQEPADAVAEFLGEAHPIGGVPGSDELLAPLLVQGPGKSLRGRSRKGAQGVAVEVDDTIGDLEEVSGRGEVGHGDPSL